MRRGDTVITNGGVLAVSSGFFLSYTKLSTFRRCRKQYWFSYLSGQPRPPDPPSAPGIVGKAVHRAMQLLVEAGSASIARAELELYLRQPGHEVAGPGTEAYENALRYFDAGVDVSAAIHAHTTWKTFFHSCGSMIQLYDEFVEAGVDIVNPVQISAEGMAPEALKARWGDSLVFWGGGIDTQHVLPFGTPEEVTAEVRQRLQIFGRGGGFVFNTIHNVQARVPRENLFALYNTFRECR